MNAFGSFPERRRKDHKSARAPDLEETKAEMISAPGTTWAFQRSASLKENLDVACELLRLQVQRIDKEGNQFAQRLKDTVATIADYYAKEDLARASVYTCVLAEKRLVMKLAVQVRLALEKIVSFLSVVSELGEVGDSLATSLEVLREVRSMTKCVLPAVETALASVENLLVQTNAQAHESGLKVNTQSASQRAMEIMEGVAQQAKVEVKERFPTQLPSGDRNPP
jgi:division protein CdvB (Snf7/Vps24/ESCRT-III family)